MKDNWYDTYEGITSCLSSLEAFHELINERSSAGYVRKENLTQWYIFGKYYFDTCGNFMYANEFIPPDHIPNIPNVLTQAGLFDLITIYDRQTKPNVLTKKELNDKGFDFLNNDREYPTSIQFALGNHIPEHKDVCPECENKWTIENHIDCIRVFDSEVISLKNFIGKSLGWVRLNYNKLQQIFGNQHHKYTLENVNQLCLRNPKYIDLAKKYPDTDHSWEKAIVINERGWVEAADDHIIEEGDEGSFSKSTCYHRSCLKEKNAKKTEEEIKLIFNKAGFLGFLILSRIPNEYEGETAHSSPWFNVKTQIGTIKIGWRKRVLSLDYSGTTSRPDFLAEDVTQWDGGIHAYGYEKAQEYLEKILEAIN